MLTTSELCDKVLEAEAETAARKDLDPINPVNPVNPPSGERFSPSQKSQKMSPKIFQTMRARYLGVSLSRGADVVGFAKSSPMAISRKIEGGPGEVMRLLLVDEADHPEDIRGRMAVDLARRHGYEKTETDSR
ncbi:MAG: hypothetical protein M1839_002991 [Geoglossum umbratile]|nr:MAG: hypothetical protein M1839_002991 [Geoglossum umbratile]